MFLSVHIVKLIIHMEKVMSNSLVQTQLRYYDEQVTSGVLLPHILLDIL